MANDAQTDHRFGGDWTTAKLKVVSAYLSAYTTALKNRNIRTEYIDAFAGTGYRNSDELADNITEEPQRLLEGSAKLALRTNPAFDAHFFIEKSEERCAALELLKEEFPERAKSISVLQGDANEVIQVLCKRRWGRSRAVLFLDPYGMQVDWKTVEAVAATKSIDMWLLFPLGIGVNRLLPRSGDVPPSWRAKLDRFLGTTDWYDEFYKKRTRKNLFGEDEELVKAPIDGIGKYFVERLKGVFEGVVEPPGILWNSTGCPLYLLCFAVANPKGAPIAMRIASKLLERLR